MLDLPLGSGALVVAAAVMENVIAESSSIAPLELALGDERASLHLYGKAPRPARKVGHLTMCGDDVAELRRRTARLAAKIVADVSEEEQGRR